MNSLLAEFRFAIRSLLKNSSFTAIAVATLALGIGANTAIFSVINALIINPPSFVEPDRITAIWRTTKDKRSENLVSYLELQDWRARNQSFDQIGAYKQNGFTLITQGQAERIQGMRVTSNFLSLLKVNLLRGRDFQPDEERRGAAPVVILSHQFWQTRFGGNESAAGQTLTLNGKAFTVIGVLPANFQFPFINQSSELLTTIAGEGSNLDERGAQVLWGIGRLKPNVSLAQAQADLTNIASGLEQRYPQYNQNVTAYLVTADEQIVGRDVRRVLWILLGAVGFILLIACTNVTNLLLVRASAREKELALRAALGAGRWRIARHLLVESLLLALLAGGAGLLVSSLGLAAIQYYGADQLPRLNEVQINGRVLVFTLTVSLLTVVLFSLLPIFTGASPDVNGILKAGAKSVTGNRSLRIWRNSLVVAEVALGLVLLIGAGLMIRSFSLLANVNPGFDPANVLTGRINLTRPVYENHDERVRYVDQTLEKLKALPGVESAAFIAPMPFSGGNVGSDFRIEGRPEPPPAQAPGANNRSVTPEYFQALRIALLRGRYFTGQDQRGGVGAAIVNESLVRRYFPNEDPIGRRISRIGANQNDGDPEQYEIVGIVGDVHHSSLIKPATPEIYLPYRQNSWGWGNFFVRTTHNPAALTAAFTEAIRSTDRTAPVTNVQPLQKAIADTFAQTRFYTFLFALFGMTGLVLALTGIYGVISFTVSQRTQEIGIRMALGARGVNVLTMLLRQGMALAIGGIAIGVVAAVALTRLMASLLFGLGPKDPLTFVSVALVVAVVALLASYLPARRATKVDPMIALRCE